MVEQWNARKHWFRVLPLIALPPVALGGTREAAGDTAYQSRSTVHAQDGPYAMFEPPLIALRGPRKCDSDCLRAAEEVA